MARCVELNLFDDFAGCKHGLVNDRAKRGSLTSCNREQSEFFAGKTNGLKKDLVKKLYRISKPSCDFNAS